MWLNWKHYHIQIIKNVFNTRYKRKTNKCILWSDDVLNEIQTNALKLYCKKIKYLFQMGPPISCVHPDRDLKLWRDPLHLEVPLLSVGRRLQDLLRPLRQQPGPGSPLQRVRQLVDVKDLVLFLMRKHNFFICA